MLVCGVLLFGCTGNGSNSNTSNGQAGNAPQDQSSGQGTQNQGSGTPDVGQETQDTGTQDTEPETPGNTQQQGTDLSGLIYSELVALGIPIQCDVSVVTPDETLSVKMYVNGDEIRSEYDSTQSNPDCETAVTIVKEDVMYMACLGQEFAPGCDWMMFETDESENGAASTGSVSPSTLEDLPATNFNCIPWIYDASKFEPSGHACTMEEMMQNMYAE